MINETSTANRNDTSSPPCWPFSKKVHDTAKLDTSHHILIPSSDTHNHKPHQPYNTTHSSSYAHLLNKTLLVLFKCIEIIAIRILHPCQIQQRPNYVPGSLKHSRIRNKSSKAWTHTRRKGFNNKWTMYQHSNGFRARNGYRKTSSYTTEGFGSRNLIYTPTQTSHQHASDIIPQPH